MLSGCWGQMEVNTVSYVAAVNMQYAHTPIYICTSIYLIHTYTHGESHNCACVFNPIRVRVCVFAHCH